jgi:thiamine-phosphate pyrophosphorylase
MPQPQADAAHPGTRLYLTSPVIEDAGAFVRDLPRVLAAADVAAVLLRLKEADERTLINRIKALAPVIQDAGAALIVDGHAELAARAGADGVHLTGVDAFMATVERLKPNRIAGCGGLRTRHDAMTVAEAGADYVMFGEPNGNRRPSFDAILERVSWWTELFEVPCVGFAMEPDEVGRVAKAGAEFVAVAGDFIWGDRRGAAAAIADAQRALAAPERVR